MNVNIKNFHECRRAFIIVPNAGLIVAEPGSILSHIEILSEMGIAKEKINQIIKECPRGFYLDDTLVIYQGDSVKEGEAWQLSVENYSHVKRVFPDMQKAFGLDLNTKIFLGVIRGKLGEEWERISQVPLSFFQ